MSDTKISNELPAGPLDGSELTEIVQSGNNRKTTTQDIANLSANNETLALSISGNTTLSSDHANNNGYEFFGTPSGNVTVTWPSFFGMAVIRNTTTNGFTIMCGVLGGSFVPVLGGETVSVWSDGTNFFRISPAGSGVGDIVYKNANYIAVADQDRTVLVDTSGGSVEISLPALPPQAFVLTIKKITGDANSLIIGGNGNNIEGAAFNLRTVGPALSSYTLQYNNTSAGGTGWWIIG